MRGILKIQENGAGIFEAYAKSQGLEVKNWYMWYTTCPACAEKYGKNYVVIISEVE